MYFKAFRLRDVGPVIKPENRVIHIIYIFKACRSHPQKSCKSWVCSCDWYPTRARIKLLPWTGAIVAPGTGKYGADYNSQGPNILVTFKVSRTQNFHLQTFYQCE